MRLIPIYKVKWLYNGSSQEFTYQVAADNILEVLQHFGKMMHGLRSIAKLEISLNEDNMSNQAPNLESNK